jgi:uroporphyrinogen decarboxylase
VTNSFPDSPNGIRDWLEGLYSDPSLARMTPYERVEEAVNLRQPDRVPFDFWGVPETIEKLTSYLKADNEEEVLRLLGIDCRMVYPDYVGPETEKLDDGTFYTPSGSHRRLVSNEFSTYEEYASFPLSEAESASEVEAWERWPTSEYWDWEGVPSVVDALNTEIPYHIRYEVGGIFESSWGLYGLDKFLIDLYDKPEVPCAIMDCYTDIFIDNVRRLMSAAEGKIDMVYTYDDVAMQNGLLMSPKMWREYILPRHQRLNSVIKEYGLKIMYHCCGSVKKLIGAFIDDMKIDVLNPLQPRAKDMDMQWVKDEFGKRIAFHGAIDLQFTLPYGSIQEVQDEVRERCNILGEGGGYICTSAHYIQADVPVENIIALYTASRTID